MQRRAQERICSPFKRRDDFFVVIEAGGVFHRDDGMGAEGERERAPEPLPGWLAQPFAKRPECFVDISHPAASSHGCVIATGLVGKPGVHVDALACADQCLVRQHGLGKRVDQGRQPLPGVVGREAGDQILDRLQQGPTLATSRSSDSWVGKYR